MSTKGKLTSIIMSIINRFKKLNSNTFLLLITICLFFVIWFIGVAKFGDVGFSRNQNFLNIFISNAGLIVIAAGMTVVMITGGIDISVGSLVALVCMLLANMMENQGISAELAVVIVLIYGMVFGIVQGFLISYLKIQPFVVTMAGMFFARGLTAMVSTNMIAIKNSTFVSWANEKIAMPLEGYYTRRGKYMEPYIYPTVIIALLIVLIIFIMLRYTKFGRSLYAVGGNEQSARLMGINVKRTKMLAYVISSFLCSIGGVLFCLNTSAGFVEQAKGLEMEAIASSVIGGTLLTGGVGNVIGSLFGVMIKATIESFITFQGTLSSWWTKIIIAALLCFFIVIQSIFAFVKSRKNNA